MFTNVEYGVRQSRGWGGGEAGLPPPAPHPLNLPYMLLTFVQFRNFVPELLVNIVSGLCTQRHQSQAILSSNQSIAMPPYPLPRSIKNRVV